MSLLHPLLRILTIFQQQTALTLQCLRGALHQLLFSSFGFGCDSDLDPRTVQHLLLTIPGCFLMCVWGRSPAGRSTTFNEDPVLDTVLNIGLKQLFTGMLPVLPLEVLEEMLLNVPPQQVVCVCRLVCREWKEVVDSDSLWRERCRREGYQTDVTKLPKDWRLFYFLCKKRRNLLKNPRADDKFKGWQIMENGGDKWKIESVEEVPLPDNTVQKYFATSYSTCRKSQLIDLEKEGYRPSFMDDFQPDIIISDWYAPRRECGAKYEICVELLNHKKQPIKKFSPGTVIFQNWDDHKWNQMTHVFKNYGPGVRYIRFIHGGKDTLYWAGWYGIRVTNSSIEICPSVDR
ncbi:F-box only protein 44-like isoform X3 [Oncorhynchus nerka]|uniref:F-box only protein 44-like isoform X3 n=1 Tax=Oncorhynchus nerka TaxID=8023 RepID=UPI0031B8ABD5